MNWWFINNSPQDFILLKTFTSEFSYTEIWLTDQTSKQLEVEVKKNITLIINYDSLFSSIKNQFQSIQTPY